MSDPLNPTPADNYAPYAPNDSGSGSYAPSQGGYAPATQEQQSYAPNGSGDASYAPSQDGYAASAQGQQPQFGQPGADQYAQYGQPGADQYAQQPQFGQPGADQYAQYGQGAQASYGQPQQAYGQPTYGQPVYGQPMYPSPASAQFDSLRTQAIIAIVVSVISWFVLWFLVSIPSVIWSFIIDSNAKNQGAPQNILSLTKAAKIVSIVMVSIQAFFFILGVIVAILD
ncbi:hypothetical protein HMPREF1478_00825 [Actinomyces sp. HPA0247]|uniref:hypothetical protein n=1 Tax=Actinomyces sp. HPA0247 TaxID=1203556 RepID=UPI00034E5BAE|nr:hypothetical protein [Actinomyces sp. HPA0247]EPD73177.1 hypothetical protein HMPREF1478_00825 [Actinomyces sp. HPA0247]